MNIKFTILFIIISLVLVPVSVAPVSAENTIATYSFVHLSDTQGLVYFPSLYDQTFTEIENMKLQYNISAIFITGDLTDGRLTDGESVDYPTYSQAISHTTIPVYEVSGNHDVFNDVGNYSMWDTYVPGGSQKHDYGFVFNDFVVYGFGWSPTDQMLNATARTGMINTIAANPTKMPIILTHGYFVPNQHDVTGDRDVIAYDILNASTRDSIILSGHTHTPTQLWYAQQVKYNNITVIEEFNNAQDWKIDEVQLSIGRLFTVTTDGSHITNLTTQDVYFNPVLVVNNTVAYNVSLYQPPTYQPPISNFTANVTSGATPLSVRFMDTSSNTPTSWNWSFTNVTENNMPVWFSTEQNPAYTFGVGNYSIVLNTSNSVGYSLSAQVTFINVTVVTIRPTNVGVFRGLGYWYLDTNNNGTWDGSSLDTEFYWGKQPGDIPITGDWNRDGITETGVFRSGGHWYLDTNNNGTWDGSPPDTEFYWGKQLGDIPITGDWNGNGITETGIFRPGTGFYLDMNNNGQYDGPSIDRFLPWGLLQPSDKSVTGKW
jgi:predicted phosphodiesterase